MTVRDLLHFGKTNIPVTRGANPIVAFQDEVNKLFNDFFGEVDLPSWFGKRNMNLAVSPAIDVVEADNQFTITAELPGIEPADIQVTTSQGYITIKGEKKLESKEEQEGYFRQERSYGSFQRVVALPESANFEKAEANFKNGVLTMSVPKKAGAQTHERRVEIKSAA